MGRNPKPTRKNIWFGWICIIAGLGTATAIHFHPENLNAPAWVAYLAMSVFVAAGVSIILQAYGRKRTGLMAVALIPIAFTVIGGWIALGDGPRMCTRSFSFLFVESSDGAAGLECRIVFGFGAVLSALVAAWMLIQLFGALRNRPAGEQ